MTNGTNIKTTDYLDASASLSTGPFGYNKNLLEFFPHAEGYVKATNLSLGNNPNYIFNYVYNYTDHLGNVRLSYAKDPQTGNLKILDESHYYPFGLKHQEYVNFGFVNNPIQGVIIAPLINNPYKYKYQGQELQDELGLNWDSFKWRNYDYAIARFMSIDPLAEKYSDYTPYQFSSNQVVHAPEIEGLENSADLNQKTLQEQHLKGEISNEVLMDNYKAQFNGTVTGLMIITPIDEISAVVALSEVVIKGTRTFGFFSRIFGMGARVRKTEKRINKVINEAKLEKRNKEENFYL